MTVWNTVANMQALDASLGSFFEVAESEIRRQDCWRVGECKELTRVRTPNRWCCYTAYARYTLRKIPRGENRNRGPGNLTIGVELWREVANQEDPWEHAKQPLIYVGFSPKSDHWSDDMALDCLGEPTWYPDSELAPPEDNAPYLWTWNGEEKDRWSLRNWFFVLQLCSIECQEDIANEIIIPVRSLLVDNSDPNIAFDGTQAVRTVVAAGP